MNEIITWRVLLSLAIILVGIYIFKKTIKVKKDNMQTDSIELGFLSIFALITFFIFLIIEKFSYKLSKGSLLDNDFDKPQSFHDEAVSRSGGIACQISLFLIIYFYYVIFDQILFEYIFIGTSLFLIGYMDDIKIMISPIIRLLFNGIFSSYYH